MKINNIQALTPFKNIHFTLLKKEANYDKTTYKQMN